MTHYDKLIDSIKNQLYAYHMQGMEVVEWDEKDADKSAKRILQIVEEFQQHQANLKTTQWRTSD
jgi:ABC-type uncharacterized transport system substrate-binding protein